MTDTTPERRAHRDDEAFDDFVAFCRSRPNESFQYMDNEDCAYARFLKETGRCACPMVGGWDWKPMNAPDSECVWLDGRLLSTDGTDSPLGTSRTFGEILQKLGL